MDSFFQAAKSEGFDDEVIEKLKGEVSLDWILRTIHLLCGIW